MDLRANSLPARGSQETLTGTREEKEAGRRAGKEGGSSS